MNKGYMVNFSESSQPLKDILIPVNRRPGYKEGETPIVPVYFYRHIGIAGIDSSQQDSFYNEIYQVHEQLLNHATGYLKIESPISMPDNEEIEEMALRVRKGTPTSTRTLKEAITSQIKSSGALNMFRSMTFNLNILSAFDNLMELYMNNEPNVNESKAENFAIKMLVWLKRYHVVLCKENQISDIPKVLFYGDIKPHEVYFITLLAFMGCDVLFIHTDKSKDAPFLNIDTNNQYAKKLEFQESIAIESFPLTERIVQKSTVAYNASQEIENMLYGADVGLFKSRQYETGITKPIMLKTTYDELKLLWHEEAKIRPEFDVKGEKVYVPNIFAKVNGTHEDVSTYWNDIHNLTQSEQIVVFKNIPFSTIQYTKQEMYSTAFLFNQDGLLNKEALFKSSVYKLHYLKTSIQDFIVSKINELITSKLFLNEIDEKLRLKILMTIITMDSELLRLIESFDYTGKVPKILVYSGTRQVLSEEDSIILAFFHLVGVDIVIFTPTNYLNIEQWIQTSYFTIHQLPSVQFDMEFKNKPIEQAKKGLKGLFKKFFQ